ncbi:hypothetical protein C8J57DRAFT_1256867 [Mycena rebaudengoi]|nr:hypothetical protein C8J57DRAFT_1256867 [Mycena rebaudengoi]
MSLYAASTPRRRPVENQQQQRRPAQSISLSFIQALGFGPPHQALGHYRSHATLPGLSVRCPARSPHITGDVTVESRHGRFHRHPHFRVHLVLMLLGPGAVAFILGGGLGVLLRMVSVIFLVSSRTTPSAGATIPLPLLRRVQRVSDAAIVVERNQIGLFSDENGGNTGIVQEVQREPDSDTDDRLKEPPAENAAAAATDTFASFPYKRPK